MAVDIYLSALCQSYFNRFRVQVLLGHCYHIRDIENGYIMYYDECDIAIQDSRSESVSHSTPGCSVSYDLDAQIWGIIFPFSTLVQLARCPAVLCTRGSGADADLVEAHQEPVLRMSSDSDHYTDAPDVSLPAPDEPLWPSLQSLRSFQVRPYLNNDCQPRYCGVFVYDWEDNKVASRGLSAELFRTSSLPSALDFIE